MRRAGKTILTKRALAEINNDEERSFNCDLPSVAKRCADPEQLLKALPPGIVVFDEVHQLPDPSRLLKIAADQFPELKVLATGSSPLAATDKFRDSLTGRKRQVHLTPVLYEELASFDVRNLRLWLLRGGLPQALLGKSLDASFYSEWLDSYFARDIQALFRVEKRTQFLRLLEATLRLSGGATTTQTPATLTGPSRPTLGNYLGVLETTLGLRIVHPHYGGHIFELVRQPRLYGFDTSFICHARGIESLRDEDCGSLWEHLILDSLHTHFPSKEVCYWRGKQDHEVDFVMRGCGNEMHAIECNWQADAFEGKSMLKFRHLYPEGKNVLIAPNAVSGLTSTYKSIQIEQCVLEKLPSLLAKAKTPPAI